MVGFTGSRSLAPCHAPFVTRVAHICAQHAPFIIGCALGLDSLMLAYALSHKIPYRQFKAADYGTGKSSFTLRSAAMVRLVAQTNTWPVYRGPCYFVGFPTSPCPPSLVPSSDSSACFAGFGSGTWSTLALAVGLQLPVFVFPIGFTVDQLPTSWGDWQPLETLGLDPCYRLKLAAIQPPLF
jgi:hypothetical protein